MAVGSIPPTLSVPLLWNRFNTVKVCVSAEGVSLWYWGPGEEREGNQDPGQCNPLFSGGDRVRARDLWRDQISPRKIETCPMWPVFRSKSRTNKIGKSQGQQPKFSPFSGRMRARQTVPFGVWCRRLVGATPVYPLTGDSGPDTIQQTRGQPRPRLTFSGSVVQHLFLLFLGSTFRNHSVRQHSRPCIPIPVQLCGRYRPSVPSRA